MTLCSLGGVPYKRPPVKNASPRPSGLDLPVTSSGDRRPDHPPHNHTRVAGAGCTSLLDERLKCEYGGGLAIGRVISAAP